MFHEETAKTYLVHLLDPPGCAGLSLLELPPRFIGPVLRQCSVVVNALRGHLKDTFDPFVGVIGIVGVAPWLWKDSKHCIVPIAFYGFPKVVDLSIINQLKSCRYPLILPDVFQIALHPFPAIRAEPRWPR